MKCNTSGWDPRHLCARLTRWHVREIMHHSDNSKQNHFGRAVVIGCAAAGLSLIALSGCVPSDTITQKVYDSNEENPIDTSVDPQLINSVNAQEKSEVLPKLVNDPKSSTSNDTSKKIPVYTKDKSLAQTDEPAARPNFSKSALNSGEASTKASKNSNSKTEQKSGETDKQKSKSGAKKKSAKQGKADKSKKKNAGSGNGSNKGKGKGKSSGSGKGTGNKSGGKGDGSGATYNGDADSEPKIPSGINEVAALGNNAVIVSIVGGQADSTPLKACDANMKKQTSSLLASKGISKTSALWSGDGSKSGSLSSKNFNKLLQKDTIPDLVFLTEGSSALTSSQIKKLKKHKVDIYYLPELTSRKRIRFAVRVVGMILAKGGVSGAETNYKNYLSEEESLATKYRDDGTKIVGGRDFDTGKKVGSTSDTIVTLYIDDWDEDARLKNASFLDTSSGVATATVGYESSPISYYLSVGNVLNNAASETFLKATDGESAIVWQFGTKTDYSFSNWTGLDSATCDLFEQINVGGTGGLGKDLLCYKVSDSKLYGLGTETFPAIIAKSKAIAKQFKAESNESGQIYYTYPEQTSSGSSTTKGIQHGSTVLPSCIGWSSLSSEKVTDYDVYVNPSGLAQKSSSDSLCSWAEGSIESPLEASWAKWKFDGGSQADFESDVTDFYKSIYGYTVTSADLEEIENGSEK